MKNHNILQSFACAFSGMAHIFKKERNMKIHFSAAIAIVILSMILNIGMNDMLWIFLAIALVMITEAMNTFFEELLNFISPQYNVSVKHMKDIAAGGVLTATIFAVIVALIVFGRKTGTDQSTLVDIVFFLYLGLIVLMSILGGEKSGNEKDKSSDR